MKCLSDYFPNGASKKQRDKFLQEHLMKGKTRSDAYQSWTIEEKCLDEELSMLDMLDSCFAYGGVSKFYHINRYGNGRSYYDDFLKYYLDKGGSKEEFDKMIEIQKKHFEHCFVEYNVHTDFEGCSYNSLIDHDEVVA